MNQLGLTMKVFHFNLLFIIKLLTKCEIFFHAYESLDGRSHIISQKKTKKIILEKLKTFKVQAPF